MSPLACRARGYYLGFMTGKTLRETPLRFVTKRGLILAAAMATAYAAPAMAADGYNHVTAHSRYGNGTVTAPVRPTRWGHEVRLPGGMWWDCAGNCAETLRQETVDFWESLDEKNGADVLDLLKRRRR